MPNWTQNYIELAGCESDIRKFLQAIGIDEQEQEPNLRFSHLIPEPDDLMDRPDEKLPDYNYMASAWLVWRRKHWGTKWEPADFSIDNENGPGQRFMQFLTAWDAPRAYAFGFVNLANLHNVQVWWDCVHEDGNQEETLVTVKEAG